MEAISAKAKRLIGLVISIIMLIQQVAPMVSVKAESYGFIKDVTLTDYKGDPLGKDVSLTSDVMVNFEFEINDKGSLKKDEEYYIDIPKEILLTKFNTEIEADDADGISIGTCTSESNGKLKIKFNEKVEGVDHVSGMISLKTKFNEDELGSGGDKRLEFKISAKKEIVKGVDIHFLKDTSKIVGPSITKEGTYDEDKNEVNWVIKLNCGTEKLSGVQIVDKLGEGQSFISNPIKVEGVEVNKSDYLISGNELQYTFANEISGVKTIAITTKPNHSIFMSNDEEKVLANDIDLNVTGKETISKHAEVSVPTKIFNKEGKYTSDRKIMWTIDFYNREASNEIVTIIDEITSNQEYVSGTLKYEDTKGIKTADGSDCINLDNGDFLKFEFGKVIFKGVADKYVKIIFETKVVDDDIFKKNSEEFIKNNASLIFGDATGSGGGKDMPSIGTEGEASVPGGLIEKSKGPKGYNTSTRELNWHVTVNAACESLINPIVTDKIENDQIFDAESIIIDGNEVKVGEGAVSYKDDVLTIELPSDNKKHDIEYNTKVKDNNVYANNVYKKEFENTASLVVDNINNKIPFSSTASQEVTSKVIEKIGQYNYSDNTITWVIFLNKNALPIKNAKVIDEIPKEQEYVDDSFSIKRNTEKSSYTFDYPKNEGEKFNYNKADETDTEKSGTIVYEFGESAIDRQYILEYKTKIVDKNFFSGEGTSEKTVKNVAGIEGDVVPGRVTVEASCKVKISAIEKFSDYVTGNDYVKWSVLINENGVDVGDATILDKLNKYLKLDTSSMKLYKVNASNGELPSKDNKSEEVEILEDQVEYKENEDKSAELKLKINNLNQPYLLEYVTYINQDAISDNKSVLSNEVEFEGGLVSGKSSSSAKNVFFTAASAIGRIQKGYIEVKKLDKGNNKPLKGVKFELFDRFNIKSGEAVTDENGIVKFEDVPYNVYYTVKEKEALEGYVLDENSSKKYKLSSEKKNISDVWYNDYIKGKVQVIKKDAADLSFISGNAKFLVYKDVDNDKIPDDDNAIELTRESCNSGVYSAELEYGKYVLVEKDAPEGYVKDANGYHFEITKNNQVENITNNSNKESFINNPITGTIKITKIDRESREKLSGAKFTVYKDNGSGEPDLEKESYVLDEGSKGEYSKVLRYGEYVLKETTPPEGYKLEDRCYAFKIKTQGENVKISENNEVENIVKKGTVTIIKVDSEKTDENLPGAKFEILEDTNKNNTLDEMDKSKGFLTEKNGVYSMTLCYGRYFIKEKEAPKGFLKDTGIYDVNIVEDGDNVVVGNDKDKKKFLNNRKMGTVKLTKVDKNKAIKLSGAKFEVFEDLNEDKEYNKNDKYVADLDENQLGVYSKKLKVGKYLLKEVYAPKGYLVDEKYYYFELTEDGDVREIVNDNEVKKFVNEPEKGSIKLTKIDGDESSKKLTGAEFTVYEKDEKNNPSKEVCKLKETLGKEGEYTSDKIQLGEYIVRETKAPKGYVQDNTDYLVKIINNNQEFIVSNDGLGKNFINKKINGIVKLTKVDSSDLSCKLSGAVFKVYEDTNTDGSYTEGTDKELGCLEMNSEGEYSKRLGYGKYFVKEETAPKGYVADNKVYPVEITKDSQEVIISNDGSGKNFINECIKGAVKVVKVDADNHNLKLDGAKFEVYKDSNNNSILDEEDLFVDSLSESVDGVYIKSGLSYGIYFIKEKAAPEGYEGDSNYYKFNITEKDEVVNVSNIESNVFVNKNIAESMEIIITDEYDKTPVKNALIKVYNEKNELVYEGKTDSEGKISFKGIKGSYTYNITDIPKGYIIDKTEGKLEAKVGEKIEKVVKISKEKSEDKKDEKFQKGTTVEVKKDDNKLDNNRLDEKDNKKLYEEKSYENIYESNNKIDTIKQVLKTGDNSKLGILIVIAAISLVAIIAISISSKRKKKI